MRLLRDFFRSMFSEWGSGLSGPASVPVAILALWKPTVPQKLCYGVLAALLGFVSAYRIWKKEHERACDAESRLESQIPVLTMSIDGASWKEELSIDKTKIWLSVTLGNGGGPTVVNNWHARCFLGEVEIPTYPNHIGPAGDQINMGDYYLEINDCDLITSKTVTNPLQRRSRIQGRFLFTVDGNRRSAFDAGEQIISLKCCDFDGRECEASFLPGLGSDELLFYPQEFVKRFTEPRVTSL